MIKIYKLKWLRKVKYLWILIIVISVLIVSSDYLLQYIKFKNSAVTIVNGVFINRQCFEKILIETYGPGLLDKLIIKELENQKIAQLGIQVSVKEIDNQVQKSIENFGDSREFWVALSNQGVTKEHFRNQIKISIALDKIVAPQIKNPTDKEIDEYFTKNRNLPEFSKPDIQIKDVKSLIYERLYLIKLETLKQKMPQQLKEEAQINDFFYNKPITSDVSIVNCSSKKPDYKFLKIFQNL